MKTSISLLITAIIALLGVLLFNSTALITSAGYAFALGAITTGITLFLFSTKSSGDIPASSSSTSKTIYVGNLPYRANESDVKELFSKYGEVFAVRLMKDKRTGKRRGFGFVVMAADDTENAIEELNNSEYGERTLKVREANDPRKSERV
ncbi:RNA recognition motif domain-containing protein [Grimontia hollisae]|uniref:RNA recognition motif domain-containing protein n=1 Tax=Grimontia hollisae TaxID=673 RepID=UPI000E03942B|nr:RNA-binding protein [Grimontia hollisae]STQ74523.1 splicing factor, CC1-like family [Grimontia hollisae]